MCYRKQPIISNMSNVSMSYVLISARMKLTRSNSSHSNPSDHDSGAEEDITDGVPMKVYVPVYYMLIALCKFYEHSWIMCLS